MRVVSRLLLLALSCSALAARGASAAGGHQHHVHLRRMRLTPASLAAQHHHQHHLAGPHRRLLQDGNATTYCAGQVAGAPAPFNATAANKTMVTCLVREPSGERAMEISWSELGTPWPQLGIGGH